MSGILLISPLSDRFNGVGNFGAPCLGVWRLRANLIRDGIRCDVWDCNTGFQMPSDIVKVKPDGTTFIPVESLTEAFAADVEARHDITSYDWVGFSILNDTLPLTLGLANYLKMKYPLVKQVAGNAEATLNYQDILDKTKIDCCLIGEPDLSISKLIRGEDPRTIEGCVWRTWAKRQSPEEFYGTFKPVNFSEIPYESYWLQTAELYKPSGATKSFRPFVESWVRDRRLAYELLPEGMTHEAAQQKLREICTVRIVTMDHCFLPCTYCSTARVPDRATGEFQRSVFLPIAACAELLKKIKREVPAVLTIYDDSDETFLGEKRGIEYANMLLSIKSEMDAGIPWPFRYLVQTRSNEMSRELVHLLAKAGVAHLTFGVENGSEHVRKSLRKPQDHQQMLDLIEWCKESGIVCYYLLILFPPETRLEDVRRNVEVMGEWVRRGATVSAEPYLMPYKGTPILDDPTYYYEHVTFEVPFSGTIKKKLKWPVLVWPKDPAVRGIMSFYRATIDDAIRKAQQAAGHAHTFKGFTGRVCVEHLALCLRLFDEGKIKPQEGFSCEEGQIHAVYQDYSDQASGVEIRDEFRRTMQSKNGRFNPSHSSIDSADLKQGALKSRLQKDPAAPSEVVMDRGLAAGQ